MIAALIRWSIANRFLVLMATVLVAAWGVWAVLRTPLDALPDLSDVQVIIRTPYPGQAPQHRRGPGHLSADDDDAVGAGREDGARLLVLRRLVRLRAVRRRHRSVLGALARARVPQPGAGAAAGAGEAGARAGCDRRRLDLRVRARRPHRPARPRRAARAAGLVPQVRAEDGAQRRRGRDASAAWCASTRSCSTRTACAPTASRTRRSSRRSRTRTTRPAARCSSWPRPSTWCARAATCRRSTISARSRSSSARAGCRCRSATSRACRSARRCGAASPSSTAKAKSPAA